MLAALFQPMEGFSVHLYEKRREYTRVRMVQLRDYLVADSVASYCTDYIDGESVEALFDASELDEGLAFRQAIAPDLMALLRTWVRGFCPLNAIERSLSELIDTRQSQPVRRRAGVVTAADAMTMLRPGRRPDRLHRQTLAAAGQAGARRRATFGANTFRVRLEYAIMVTFLYDQAYECNEYCKFYKNIENAYYKFIPAVNRTFHDGSITHVTGIINITEDDYEGMPWQFDGQWLRAQLPVYRPVDGPIHHQGQPGKPCGKMMGDLEIVRIPMGAVPCPPCDQPAVASGRGRGPPLRPGARCSWRGTRRWGRPTFSRSRWASSARCSWRACWRSATCRCAIFLDRYELYAYKQWLRVYMRSKMIKHNKDVFEVLGDNFAALEKLHIY